MHIKLSSGFCPNINKYNLLSGVLMKNLSLLVFGSFCVLSFLNSVQAENGIINAVSLQALPSSRTILIQPLDDSIDNLALQKIIKIELSKRGYRVDSEAPLILMFTTHNQMGNWGSTSRREIFSLQTQTGRGHKEKTNVRVNIYQSAKGGLLNEGNGQSDTSSMSNQYRLDVTLENQSNGSAYWQAWSTANLKKGDGYSLTKQMILPTIKSIGQTVRHQEFLIN